MDETTKAIINKITLKGGPPRTLPSGDLCHVFYDCAKLVPSDLARLAAEAIGDLPEDAFDVAVGIAYSGIFFAYALAGGRHVAILQTDGGVTGPVLSGCKVVLVDDVVHKGRKLNQAKKKLEALGATVVGFACIVDRSSSSVGTADMPLWSAYQTEME